MGKKKKILLTILTLIVAYVLSFVPVLLGTAFFGVFSSFGSEQFGQVGVQSVSSSNISVFAFSLPSLLLEIGLIVVHFSVCYAIALYLFSLIEKKIA